MCFFVFFQHVRKAKWIVFNLEIWFECHKTKGKQNNKATNKTTWKERKFAVKQQINQVLFGTYLKFGYICATIADQARPAHIDWNIHIII